jgi:rhodanese-related sulfurtransferase
MNEPGPTETRRSSTLRGGAVSGVTWIVVAGSALGIGYNALGLEARDRWGVPWVARDRMADLDASKKVVGSSPEAPDPYATDISDPRAIRAGTDASLPEIPPSDSPIEIERTALRQYVDAHAALVLDAREPSEYAAGHIPGAVNLPYDQVAGNLQRLEQLDTAGRPVVVYCGGGSCEMSLSLAWDLVTAGQTRVAVYKGGYPDWTDAGFPTETGTAP